MDKPILDELKELEALKKEAQGKYDRCLNERNASGMRDAMDELSVIANRAKHLLFKIGKYRYPDDEVVEYEPGHFMPANVYHMLKD